MEDLIYSDNYECSHDEVEENGLCPSCGHDLANKDETEELNFDDC